MLEFWPRWPRKASAQQTARRVGAPLTNYWCSWTVPVSVPVQDALCGVRVSVAPETQYEYSCSPVVITSSEPDVVKSPSVEAYRGASPMPPGWSTVARHEHPPLASSVQETAE